MPTGVFPPPLWKNKLGTELRQSVSGCRSTRMLLVRSPDTQNILWIVIVEQIDDSVAALTLSNAWLSHKPSLSTTS